ncbi:hypothetical protein GCM10010220_56180 [Streptomyces parvulus]|nr:hypothetical protein GCM10010220_56180 [Streptomyces parvulus]
MEYSGAATAAEGESIAISPAEKNNAQDLATSPVALTVVMAGRLLSVGGGGCTGRRVVVAPAVETGRGSRLVGTAAASGACHISRRLRPSQVWAMTTRARKAPLTTSW